MRKRLWLDESESSEKSMCDETLRLPDLKCGFFLVQDRTPESYVYSKDTLVRLRRTLEDSQLSRIGAVAPLGSPRALVCFFEVFLGCALWEGGKGFGGFARLRKCRGFIGAS